MADSFSGDHFAMRAEMRIGLTLRHAFVTLPTEGLPEPLRKVAEDMGTAPSDDVARAAASEFLTLSEEWVDPA